MRMGSAMGAIDQRTGIAGRTVVCAAVSKPVPSALGNAVVQGMRRGVVFDVGIWLLLCRGASNPASMLRTYHDVR